MSILTGVQQLQIGKILSSRKKALEALLCIKESCFDVIELNGFMIRKTPIVAKVLLTLSGMGIKKSQRLPWPSLLEESGLPSISIHEDLGTLESNFRAVEEEIALYKPKYVVLTGMYRFRYDDEVEVGKLIVRLNRIGRRLKEKGVSFLYHNHSVEFQNIDEETKAFDLLISGLNPDWVNFEFDSYWCLEAGSDPLHWMEKLGPRMRIYHICDRGNPAKGPYLTPILPSFQIELGQGSSHLEAYIQKARELKVDAIILEQHKHYIDGDPLHSIRVSGEYLRKALSE